MKIPRTQRLLERTAGRLYLVQLTSRLHVAGVAASAAIFLALCASRLLGLFSSEIVLRWFWVPLAAAVVVAITLARKPRPREAARVLDERSGSKELFLTASLLTKGTAPFSPIVVEQAEARAGGIDAQTIVPLRWKRPLRDIVCAVAFIAVLASALPQLDPFKKQEARLKFAQQERRLEATRQATLARAEQLQQSDAKENEKIQQVLAALEKTFKEAKPQQREANLKRLAELQKEIGEAWRRGANQQRSEALDQGSQKFGQASSQRAQQWREEMKKGETNAIRKEMEAIKNEMQKIAAMPEGAEKRAEQEKLSQQMSQLTQALQQTAASPQLQAALQRAMEQLDLSKLSPMSKEALDAAQQSMSLSEQELERLSHQMKNQQSLEDALKNLQMAKQLADQQRLDGRQADGCKSMADYEALYRELSQNGTGQVGPGMGPQGKPGAGGKAEENDTAATSFKQERSPTHLSAGQTLLQWKTHELGPKGTRPEGYQEAVREVKQGVSEAIAAERVPPGYHEAIQKYFDALPSK